MTDIAGRRPRLTNAAPLLQQARQWLTGLFFLVLYRPPRPATLGRYVGERTRLPGRTAAIALIVGFCFVYGFAFSLFAPAFLVVFAAPPAVLALLVIWALPDSRVAPTRTLTRLFYAYLACLIMWPNYISIVLPGLPWITLARLTGFPMVFFLLVCVSISAHFRTELSRSLRSLPLMWMLLAVMIVIETVSIGFSANKAASIQRYLVIQIGWTATFFISAYMFRRPGRIELWALLLWGMALYECVLGVWEYKLKKVPWAGHIPSFLKIDEETANAIMSGGATRSGTTLFRIKATFSTSLTLAEFLALTIPFLLHFLSERYKTWVRVAAAASLPPILLVIYLTNSRLGMMGAFVSFLIYPFIMAARAWMQRKHSILGPAVVAGYPVIFMAAIASTFAVSKVRKLVWGGGAQQHSTDARRIQWEMGLPKVFKNPLGYGVGQSGVILGYAPAGFLTIDSYYLSLLLDYGVIGAAVYVALLGTGLYGSGRRLLQRSELIGDQAFMAPIFVALLNFLVIKTVLAQIDNDPLLFMIMGMIVAAGSRPATAEGGVSFLHKPRPAARTTALVPAPILPAR